MCGITGYVGGQDACGIVFEGLKKLEYRGYDSWGIAYPGSDGGNGLEVFKRVGKVGEAKSAEFPKCGMAIGHTRWATHGRVCKRNTHPHLSNDGSIAVVHNGIIENFEELRSGLKERGYRFVSETDTEVIPNLVEDCMRHGAGFFEACRQAFLRLEGRYAVVAMCLHSKELIGAKKGSPLVIGVGKAGGGFFIASDVSAFIRHTREALFLGDSEIAAIGGSGTLPRPFSLVSSKELRKPVTKIEWDAEDAERGIYEHFMLKEIMEQKESISRVGDNAGKIMAVADMINNSFGTFLVGCGTAGRVCHAGTYMFSRIAKRHVNFTVASEFPNYEHFLTPRTLMIAVSQSGETADTLEAIDTALKAGVKIVSVVNAPCTSMHRKSDLVLEVNAGPEKAVASTKATTNQLAIMAMLAYACIGEFERGRALVGETVRGIEPLFGAGFLGEVKELAESLKNHGSIYIIGRGPAYPIALEAAIKLQEVSYIHAEGFAGGELKHGPIALVDEGTMCMVLAPADETFNDTIGNAIEVKSRGGFIIGISPKKHEVFDAHIEVPDAGELGCIPMLVPIQLLAYYLALVRGNNPDFPRNLAKSVTVK